MSRSPASDRPRWPLVVRSVIDWALIAICLIGFLVWPTARAGQVGPATVREFVWTGATFTIAPECVAR